MAFVGGMAARLIPGQTVFDAVLGQVTVVIVAALIGLAFGLFLTRT
jgi:hypothetical protein